MDIAFWEKLNEKPNWLGISRFLTFADFKKHMSKGVFSHTALGAIYTYLSDNASGIRFFYQFILEEEIKSSVYSCKISFNYILGCFSEVTEDKYKEYRAIQYGNRELYKDINSGYIFEKIKSLDNGNVLMKIYKKK